MAQSLKRPANLQLDNEASEAKRKNFMLSTPDVNMLQLTSPELERYIYQQMAVSNGIQTPTPTQILFPKFVSEDSEKFTEGFVNILNELHRKKDGPISQNSVVSLTTNPISTINSIQPITGLKIDSDIRTMVKEEPQTVPTITCLPNGINLTEIMGPMPVKTNNGSIANTYQGLMMTNAVVNPVTSVQRNLVHNYHMQPDERNSPHPMTRMQNSPMPARRSDMMRDIAPIDMDKQEDVKLERKRERNRVAARNCRSRKIERISTLEGKVAEIKTSNADLSHQIDKLKNHICHLKEKILEHAHSGCGIIIPSVNS